MAAARFSAACLLFASLVACGETGAAGFDREDARGLIEATATDDRYIRSTWLDSSCLRERGFEYRRLSGYALTDKGRALFATNVGRYETVAPIYFRNVQVNGITDPVEGADGRRLIEFEGNYHIEGQEAVEGADECIGQIRIDGKAVLTQYDDGPRIEYVSIERMRD